MKILIFTGLLFLCLVSTKNHNTASAGSSSRHKSADTIFLLKEHDTGYYHIVYVEKNRKSIFYKDLLNFKMDKGDNGEYHANLTGLKSHFRSFKKYKLEGLPKEWLPLYRYKGKYYIYYPSEGGLMGRETFTDSTLVDWTIEGPLPEPIQSAKRVNAITWDLDTYCRYCESKLHSQKIKIHILNNSNQMAVWEFPDEIGPYRYELYIPRASAAKFDMAVNYCAQNKTAEFMFDEIDYKALLKQR